MKIQNLSPAATLRSLHSDTLGLNSAEAEKRLAEYGKNSIERRKREKTILIFSRELSNLLAIVLWITATIVFSTAFVYSQKDMYPLGFAIIGVILINAGFSFWQSIKAEQALEALQNILPPVSLVLRSAQWLHVAAENLVPGDIVSLREGDTAAADIRLLESHALRVDTSHITGASQFSAGPEHNCILNTAQEAWCWGQGSTFDLLGDGQRKDSSVPVKVIDFAPTAL